MKLAATFSLLLVGLGGCVEVKVRPAPEGGAPCQADAECAAETPVCDTASTGTCVQCLPDRAEACTGTTPACGSDSVCRACSAHADCASDACLPDGSCAEESAVVYLEEAGTGASCTKAAPCGSAITAVAQVTATRPIIRIDGSIGDPGTLITDKTVTFLGAAGASLQGGGQGGQQAPVLDIRGTSKVAIYDVTFSNARAVALRVDGVTAELTLVRSKVLAAQLEGVSVVSGKATISRSEISGCGGGTARRGIALISGELVVERSMIADNGGGISIAEGQRFSITGSFIVGNRVAGGVDASKPGGNSVLAFNTIVDNRDEGTGATDAGGVACDERDFTAPYNILFRNTGGASRYAQTVGNCNFDGSFLSSNTRPETGSLGFVKDSAPFDYHLSAASPATVRDVAGVACTGVDFDGDARPQGAGCELGADEIKL
jgi:Right handed beta helix region